MNAQEKWVGSKSLALLRQGPFRRYIIGSLISDSGTWMQMMAQSWVMSGLTSKAILLGLVNFAAGLPALILAPVAGSLADRLDKRKILVATQIAQIVFAVALGFLVMSGQIRIWHIVFFALLLGIAFAYEMPAISALVPELVKRDEIAAAIALDRSVFHGSRLIGPSLAGLLVGWWGAASAFFTNALSFVALIAALISLPKRPMGTPEEEQQRRSGILEGFRYVRSNRIIVSLITLIALNTIFVFPAISVMLPLYVRDILHLGAKSMGGLMAISGSGAFLGSIGLLSVARENRLKFMTGNVVAIAVGVFLMSVSQGFLLTACAMGATRHCPLNEFWPYEHDRAGTSAGAFARSRISGCRHELFRSDACCRPDHPRFRRSHWNANDADDCISDLWNRCFFGFECCRTPRLRSAGFARTGA